ncbi:hypothetical protein [Mucilaginibacter lappiensis]|uniref:hypothetical protein n=1 Tax=Mucilaginibacter lappiensis TaxID=354630 RepID=UPI003D217E8D
MSELTQREILIKEEQAIQEIIEEHLHELDILNANLQDVYKLIADFDAGLNQNPWDTYKILYNIDQDNV